jgi:hypothetical protein
VPKVKKLLLAAVASALLVAPVRADKISDTFSEVEGTWCYSSATNRLDQSNSGKGYITTIYKKPCVKTRGVDWISVDKVVTLKGSEYTCVAVEGGDAGVVSVPYGSKGSKTVDKMVFSFKHRCVGEGWKWTQTTRFLITGRGELFVGVKK